MEEDIELVILVNSEKVIGEKLLRKASQSFVKIRKNELSFLEKRILLDMVFWKSCRKKGGGGKFLYNNLKKEPYLDLEDKSDSTESMKKEECLEWKRLL